MDVPMSRVKFNVNGEYAYIQNFKVLQSKQFFPEALRARNKIWIADKNAQTPSRSTKSTSRSPSRRW